MDNISKHEFVIVSTNKFVIESSCVVVKIVDVGLYVVMYMVESR